MIRTLPVLVLVGCGRVYFDPFGEDAGADASAPCTLGELSAPVRVMGDVSLPGEDDWTPAVTQDELRLYLYSLRTGNAELYMAERMSLADPFGPAMQLAISSAARDRSPRPTADELTLFFTSDRDGQDAVYTATRPIQGAPFGNVNLVTELDSAGDEDSVAVSPDGLHVVFSSTRAGDADLYEAFRERRGDPFGTVRALDEINSPSTDYTPAISADGRELYFVSNRPGGVGLLDVYRATRAEPGELFANLENIAIVNSSEDEHGPFLSANGRNLYFAYNTRIAGVSTGDVWVASRSCL